jgi:ketosteroid isomerase-like protein
MTGRAQQNLAVLQGYFDAMAAGGPQAAMPFYSEHVVLDVPGHHPASGRYEGHEGIGRFGLTMAAISGGTFRLTPVELIAGEQHLVTVADATATVHGKTLTWRRLVLSTVEAGKLRTLRFFETDQDAVDELLSQGSAE